MSQVKELIDRIREHEQNALYAIRTNETELPQVRALLANVEGFGLGDEDSDLQIRLSMLRESVNKLTPHDISTATLVEIQNEVQSIIEQLSSRYQKRMEQHASRHSYL